MPSAVNVSRTAFFQDLSSAIASYKDFGARIVCSRAEIDGLVEMRSSYGFLFHMLNALNAAGPATGTIAKAVLACDPKNKLIASY